MLTGKIKVKEFFFIDDFTIFGVKTSQSVRICIFDVLKQSRRDAQLIDIRIIEKRVHVNLKLILP